MMTSPASKSAPRAAMVSSVGLPEGTITQAARGELSFFATSSSEAAGSAPLAAAASRACSERSKATTSWPPFSSRSVMLAPILPRPIMAIFIVAPHSPAPSAQRVRVPVLRSARCSADLAQVVDRHPQHAPPVGEQALVVADRLGADERAEVVGLAGDGELGLGRSAHQLDGDHRVGAALVQLAGRVQKARAVAGGDGRTDQVVPDPSAQRLQRVVLP